MGKNRKPMKTTREEAIDYWVKYQDESGLSVDWAEAKERCWRCGCERNLQRCHIVPHALGGKDEPSNIVLLCERCHADGPNVADPEIMWDWIRSYGVPFYDTFWSIKGMREYRHIYGNRFMDDFQKIVAASSKQYSESQLETMLRERLDQLKGDVSIHFGQPYLNDATMAGLYRMLLKKMAEELEVDENKWKTGERMKPWWIEC